jgi:hypothetical protein
MGFSAPTKSVAQRLLATLAYRGFFAYDSTSRRYRIGPAVIQLARMWMPVDDAQILATPVSAVGRGQQDVGAPALARQFDAGLGLAERLVVDLSDLLRGGCTTSYLLIVSHLPLPCQGPLGN